MPETKLSDEQKAEGWIEWHGGSRPVPPDTVVEYRMFWGSPDTNHGVAGALRWSHEGSGGDIIAYRVPKFVKPPYSGSTVKFSWTPDAIRYADKHGVGDSHEALTFHKLPVVDTMPLEPITFYADKLTVDGQVVLDASVRSVGIGDINGTAKGSGARFNAGKSPVELIPLRQVGESYLLQQGLTGDQYAAAKALVHIGDYQSRARGVEALYDAMLALGLDGWEECAQVFDYGRRKYSEFNWARGMKWSVPIACAGRHLMYGILQGEATDKESGKPHRGHCMCNLCMLITFAETYPEGDDRPAAGLLAPSVETTA